MAVFPLAGNLMDIDRLQGALAPGCSVETACTGRGSGHQFTFRNSLGPRQ
jgi:hypothetical protein